MDKKIISLWSLLSLVMFIICDFLMGENAQDLIKTIIVAAVLYLLLIIGGLLKWRLAYHFLLFVVGIYTLAMIRIVFIFATQSHSGVSVLAVVLAVLGIIVNLLWYRIAAKQIKGDYVRIVKKNVKK
ncbi:hypothetical protein AKUH3B101J_01690 [Apilactobacillus kunkeei]|uniref:hypothetical protein n=1 Tax=Apilactobacillus kunkeei TaxID=148814 RepID=UPI00200B823C|nr:hypothetical protein [Apilactobacillus kunkeei]MCK8628310.1 hypothetical protein [Apilactobacillus kunkeei]CAI2558844.1 hypothetical protein AKUH3B104J_01690 [Apilactobacillus kunkeei]CAI2559105.1 hypothetical protein AKUH3B101J_01690 [Apilactobacillus kunkeei]CAI2559818.1 hypothetical protein AKUH4B402J_01820 [Apilactobacillus kunkeei]CAI2618309.1 hypothetical protein AKUA2103_01710 [Apilactobacillus kunkeei]